MKYVGLFLCFIISATFFGQTKIKGQVIDIDNAVPIAFASVSYNKNTIIADWEGKFLIEVKDTKLPIKINYKGYYEKAVYVSDSKTVLIIKLVTDLNDKKAEIYSEIKVNNIIKKVIENKKITIEKKRWPVFNIKIMNTFKLLPIRIVFQVKLTQFIKSASSGNQL